MNTNQQKTLSIFLWTVLLLAVIVSCNRDNRDKKNGEPTPAEIPAVVASLEEAKQETQTAKSNLATVTQNLATAKENLATAKQEVETGGNDNPAQTTTPNPDSTAAQKKYQKALENFKRIKAEQQAQQAKVAQAEAEEKQLTAQLERMEEIQRRRELEQLEVERARQAKEQAEYDALSRTEQGQANAERSSQRITEKYERFEYILSTSEEDKAFHYKYPDFYMNKVSNQEAIAITTDFCSKLQVSPEQAGYMQPSYATCEEYTNWLGFRSGLSCVCRFTNTLHNMIFYYRKHGSAYSSRTVSDWPEIYEKLTSPPAN